MPDIMKFLSTILFFCLFIVFNGSAQQRLLKTLPLDQVHPNGWLEIMLDNQTQNFIKPLDSSIFPFSQGGWGTKPFLRMKNGSLEGFWVPYEQTAYFYDGVIRTGFLLGDTLLVKKVRSVIYSAIEQASHHNGVIESIMAKGDMARWPHAVFFRALMAEYEVSRDHRILEALSTHYKNDYDGYYGRDLCNVEILVWLYNQTSDNFFKEKALSFGRLSKDGTIDEPTMKEFSSDKRQEIHAVTFHEMLKLPILFYELTGNKIYLNSVRNAFDKIDRFNMLPDGVASGEEGLSGRTSINTREMCNVIDYMWTCSYMLRATKEAQWGDRIEKALFNAGMGGITKKFDAHQYASSPNQVVCNDYSCMVSAYDPSRMAFRLAHRPPCCTGNINRMFPVYIGSQWMYETKGTLYKSLYGAGEVTYTQGEAKLRIKESSTYPFGDTIKLVIQSGEAKLDLKLRIPEWAVNPTVSYNQEKAEVAVGGTFFSMRKVFKKGDVVKLVFPKKVYYKRWDTEAMVLYAGPILMALPVKSTTRLVDVYTPKLQKEVYRGYSMMAASDWNYILGIENEQEAAFRIVEEKVGEKENPWERKDSPLKIRVPAFRYSAWTLSYSKNMLPSGEQVVAPATPALPARGSMIYALNGLKPEAIDLIPYGSTLLRISMFPFWRQGVIPAEVLATD